MTPAVSDLQIERYRLGELPAAEAAALERRLGADPDLARRVAALAAEDEPLRARLDETRIADGVRRRLASATSRKPAGLRLQWSAAALAVAVMAATLIVPHGTETPMTDTRLKGAPRLAVFRKMPAGSEALADGALVRTGDLLRIGYRGAQKRYGAIVSIDGRGTVTRHLPRAGDRAVPLREGATVLLDHAYELDDAPGRERFYLLTGDAPFPLSPVLEAAAQAGGAPRLPVRLDQSTFVLEKETSR